jgi:hypothetical protein
MAETNQAQNLLTTLRDTLSQLTGALEHTREEVDDIADQTERLRAGVAALGELRQREDTSVGIEMFSSVLKVEMDCDWCHTGSRLDSIPTQGVTHDLHPAIPGSL